MKSTQRHGKAAFTLVELMAVIAIMVILAALVMGGIGFVQDKRASSQAKVQMALLSKAIEEYKLDRGAYPPSADSLDGKDQSKELFKALFWDSDADGSGGTADTDQKVYLPELDPASSKQGWTSGTASDGTKIVDPWGNEYRYRSAFGAAPSGGGAAPPNNNTQNPDFDLWSAGKGGKSEPATPSHKDNLDDIKSP